MMVFDVDAGRFSNVAVEAERVRIVISEKLLLARRAWRIGVPIVPLACDFLGYLMSPGLGCCRMCPGREDGLVNSMESDTYACDGDALDLVVLFSHC